ncbi:hypothetical protein ACFOWX_02210 [Sphingorhabdus arenilitoris]|uniref:TonB-dependent receptor n=1 Tax=Sphingorhabdus arenilitoris TaxID=1490041 RepID=A0ABV8RCZ5_9SPHN
MKNIQDTKSMIKSAQNSWAVRSSLAAAMAVSLPAAVHAEDDANSTIGAAIAAETAIVSQQPEIIFIPGTGTALVQNAVQPVRASASPIAIAVATAPAVSASASALTPDAAASEGKPAAPVQADEFNIQFRADTLIVQPVLNVGLMDSERTAAAGQTVSFLGYSNYPAFIEKGELRIFRATQSPDGEPLAVIPVDQNGTAPWQVPDNGPSALFYVYRVYAKDGKFDETAAQELTIVDKAVADTMAKKLVTRPNFGKIDEAARRTIDLSGIMATVTGTADPDSDIVRVSGQFVPVDADGKFAAQQIVSRQDGDMQVSISRGGKEVMRTSQSFAAPKDDWFIVGQGEVTLGKSFGSGPASIVSGDSLADGSYAIGRGAFYAKGVVGDDVRVTASLDTGETLVKDLLSNLDRKDPRQLLRRLNSDQYYPTYGDDSTLVEDAPTQGRFYLRVNKDASQLVVGNFVTQINGAELAQLDRGLFGALVDINSKAVTGFGERKLQLTGFASDPGTVPGREEFRGTGGSLYFLKRQDISVGSERLRIEVRDRETGLVLESRDLHPQQDYDFDPFQGRLTLLSPLASTAATGSTVREGSSAGNVPVLVVRYEYTPPIGSLDGYTVGGRASGWLTDDVRLGITGQRDTVEQADQTVLGADILLRVTAGTYVKAEIAQSDGPGFGQSNSIDGGLSFTDIANPGTTLKSKAWRTEAGINFAELTGKSGDLGSASAYYENQDAGFSSAGRLTPADTERWGFGVTVPVGTLSLSAKYDTLTSGSAGQSETGTIDIANKFAVGTGSVTAKAGLRYEDRTPGLLYNSVQDGERTDAAAEIEYKPGGTNLALYGFGQATLERDAARSRNNRAGGGIKAELSERLSLNGELSGGDGGLGADVQLNHRLSEGSEAYVGYALFADRTDTGLDSQNIFTRSNRGTLTLGARQRFTDSLSVYGENRVGIGGTAPSLTRNFGLRFDPSEKLSFTGSFENGRIDDATTGPFKRTAASIGVGYTAEDVRVGTSIELRNETGVGRDQTVWLWRNDFSYAVNPDWRVLGRFNIAQADNEGPSIRAAEFTEAVAGFAYRPVNNERLNALVRFTYFEDLGPAGQVTGSGTTESPKQVSSIGSIDINYDLSRKFTLGAKYGYRSGRVSLARDSEVFVSSDAHLGVVRLDYHLNKEWDITAEGRALWVTAADDKRLGALGAVYRHLGNNVKLGVGYSLSDFSDDLTDQSYSSHGPFINILGKF